jgi:polysaccharide biosynthesis/export protein
MKIYLTTILMLGLIEGVGAAQDARSPVPLRPAINSAAGSPYRLSAGDSIELRFFFNAELNEQTQIRPDGAVSLQLVGEVRMAGKTVEEVLDELQSDYSKYLRRPEINLQIRGFANQKIYVTGQVVKPGLVSMPGQLTVFEALGEAGGVTRLGNNNRVVLIRKGPTGLPERRQLKLIDHGKVTEEAGLTLRPFDVILVPESKIAKVDRWVDEYLRQTNPTSTVLGFQYVYNRTDTGIPF